MIIISPVLLNLIKKIIMNKIAFLFAGLLLLAAMPEITNAQAISSMNEISFSTFIPCANDGLGEAAVGTLVMHNLIVTDKRGITKKTHSQPAGGSLVGLVTGTVYHPTGVTQSVTNLNSAYTDTYINRYHMVGEGGIQYFVRVTYHLTVNANGEIVVLLDKVNTTCK
jgi:hypothetical protein